MLGPRGKKIEDCRKIQNENLHGLLSSPDITNVIKLGKMRWAEHVVLVGEKRNAYGDLVI
jgi:hypothetical protein